MRHAAFWLVYLFSALLGFSLTPAISTGLFGDYDSSATFIFALGVVVTTIGVGIFYPLFPVRMQSRLLAAFIVGLLAFIPGFLIGFL